MPIQLGPQRIARLSGPIEAHLLIPIPSDPQEDLPTFLLLGDRHNSMKKVCSDCECKGPDDPNCCLEIFSDQFLSLLDEMAGSQPISFYTEFYEPKKEKQLFETQRETFRSRLRQRLSLPPKGVMQMLRENLITCYLQTNSEDPQSQDPFCPTHHIDWEYGDLRQLDTSLSMEELIQKETYFYEAILFRTMYFLYNLIDKRMSGGKRSTKNPELEQTINFKTLQKLLGPEKYAAYCTSLQLLLLSPREFAAYFTSSINPLFRDHSQLRRVSTLKDGVIRSWMELLLNYYTSQGKKLDKGAREWSNVFRDLKQDTHFTPSPKEPKDPIVLIDVSLPFLDLYFILHSIAKDHVLSIGYFGTTHIQGIVHLLVHKLKLYTDIHNGVKGSSAQERCLVLDKVDWNLNKAATKAKKRRSK